MQLLMKPRLLGLPIEMGPIRFHDVLFVLAQAT